jgi:hypothetical protein
MGRKRDSAEIPVAYDAASDQAKWKRVKYERTKPRHDLTIDAEQGTREAGKFRIPALHAEEHNLFLQRRLRDPCWPEIFGYTIEASLIRQPTISEVVYPFNHTRANSPMIHKDMSQCKEWEPVVLIRSGLVA